MAPEVRNGNVSKFRVSQDGQYISSVPAEQDPAFVYSLNLEGLNKHSSYRVGVAVSTLTSFMINC